MESPKQSFQSSEQNLEQELQQEILLVEQNLDQLKHTYAQMLADKQRQVEFVRRFDEINQEMQQTTSRSLKVELKQIKEQLESLDNALGLFSESYLVLFGGSVIFTKSGLKDLFWQVVRFGGLGVIIGWLLRSTVG
jgi:exonuclease VII large subunit